MLEALYDCLNEKGKLGLTVIISLIVIIEIDFWEIVKLQIFYFYP